MAEIFDILDHEISLVIQEQSGSQRLSEVLSQRIKNRLSREFGTQLVYIPAADKKERNHRIRDEVRNGKTQKQVAKQFHVSAATVRRITRSFGPDDWVL